LTKLIAHRGLLEGPSKEKENSPEQITQTLNLGYDCEIDLWLVDNQLYLGHDEPTYHIGDGFLNKPGLWIHAKNLSALNWLTTTNLTYFWHQNDDYTITSNKYIWSQPGKPTTNRTIVVMPEWIDPNFENIQRLNCFGICSDYITKIQKFIQK
jgi:hypothetical protein